MSETKGRYAAGTTTSAARSLEEVKKTLGRFGAVDFAYAESAERIAMMFVTPDAGDGKRNIRFVMFLPDPDSSAFRPAANNQYTASKSREERARELYRREVDRRWRALSAGIKAKLILVEEGIETVEQAFYSHILLPSGNTIWEETHEQVKQAYVTGQMPALLPGLPGPEAKRIEAAKTSD